MNIMDHEQQRDYAEEAAVRAELDAENAAEWAAQLTQHTILSRELKAGDAVSAEAQQMLSNGLDVPSTWTGTDVSVVEVQDDNYGDSYLIEWSDGCAFDVHPGLRITVTRNS